MATIISEEMEKILEEQGMEPNYNLIEYINRRKKDLEGLCSPQEDRRAA